MGVILSTAKDLFFGPVLFVVLNAVKDLFLPFKGQARILRRLRLLRMTEGSELFVCHPERSEGSVFAFQGSSPDPSSPAAPQDDKVVLSS